MKKNCQTNKCIWRPRWHVLVLFAVIFVPFAWYGTTSIPHCMTFMYAEDFEQGWPFPYFEGKMEKSEVASDLSVLDRFNKITTFSLGKLLADLVIIAGIAGVPAVL